MMHRTPSRQHPRVPIDVVVTELDGDRACTVVGRDISTGGLYVDALDRELLDAETLTVEFTLPGDDEPVWARCEVVRDDRTGHRDGHALRFARLGERDRARIARYVSRYFAPVARPLARIQPPPSEPPARTVFMFRSMGEMLC